MRKFMQIHAVCVGRTLNLPIILSQDSISFAIEGFGVAGSLGATVCRTIHPDPRMAALERLASVCS
jgi:hypothetical protein